MPFGETARSFIEQEATHRHLHAQYNAVLERQGLRYVLQRWIAWRGALWPVLAHAAAYASPRFHPQRCTSDARQRVVCGAPQ